MKNKIWKPGDIITTADWNYIKDNSSILGAYRLPIALNENGFITINMSYNQITTLLKQGIICYYIQEVTDENMININFIIGFNDSVNSISDSNSITFIQSSQNPNIMIDKTAER